MLKIIDFKTLKELPQPENWNSSGILISPYITELMNSFNWIVYSTHLTPNCWSTSSDPADTEEYSEFYQTCKMELFEKIVKDLAVNIFAKNYILDVWLSFEYASAMKTSQVLP